jgi:hypothetical protein
MDQSPREREPFTINESEVGSADQLFSPSQDTAPQEQGTDESRVLGAGDPEQSSPPVPDPPLPETPPVLLEPIIDQGTGAGHSAPAASSSLAAQIDEVPTERPKEVDNRPTDHESLFAMGLENERGRWLGDDEPSWIGVETDEWYLTNWSGYRNYHCKHPGCAFAIVSGRPSPQIAMEDHYRNHRAPENVYQESMNEARRLSLRRQGFVDERGNPL